jgi:hypothetical protein
MAPPKLPEVPFKRGNREAPIVVEEERRKGFSGPPAPHILKQDPHEDLGEFLNDLGGDIQGLGGWICDMLDKPFEAVTQGGLRGPHRLIDNGLNLGTGMGRNLINKVLRPSRV